MSALPPKADIDQRGRDVRFVPKAATPLMEILIVLENKREAAGPPLVP